MSKQRLLFGVLGLCLFTFESADAQLFPNLYIRRQRPDPSTESPIIKMHRDLYYGYHPTEWTRFPAGWGLNNPETINREELTQQVNKEIKRLEEEYGPSSKDKGNDDGLPPRGGAGRDNDPGAAIPRPVPLPSEENSPFNLDNNAPKPPARGPGNAPATPPAAPELPKAGDSPFDLPTDKPTVKPDDEIPPRPRTAPRTSSTDDFNYGNDVAAIEAPVEVMRAPQRNAFKDALSSLNPRSWMRR